MQKTSKDSGGKDPPKNSEDIKAKGTPAMLSTLHIIICSSHTPRTADHRIVHLTYGTLWPHESVQYE